MLMSSSPTQHSHRPSTPYQQPRLAADAAFFGHYEPSRARVQLLLEYALAHDHDPFWRALARRLSTPGCTSPWNAAIAAAQEAGVAWTPEVRIRRIVYGTLYEGRVAGRSRGAPAFDPELPVSSTGSART